jgi:hypothetical protein
LVKPAENKGLFADKSEGSSLFGNANIPEGAAAALLGNDKKEGALFTNDKKESVLFGNPQIFSLPKKSESEKKEEPAAEIPKPNPFCKSVESNPFTKNIKQNAFLQGSNGISSG